MRKLVIEKSAVKNNLAVIKERAAGAVIYGVLSGDGGGAGIAALAQLLRDEGIGHFAVSEVSEAQALREAGFVDEEILMLRSTTDREELERLVDLNAVCTISSVDTGMALNALAENRSTVVEATFRWTPGWALEAFWVGEPEKILLGPIALLPNVALSGIYTQLHAAQPNDPEAKQQLEQFHRAGHESIPPALRPEWSMPPLLLSAPRRQRPAGRRAGRLRYFGAVPTDPGRRIANRWLWGSPSGRGPLAAQGPHHRGGQAPCAEKAYPSGRPTRGLSERLWRGAPRQSGLTRPAGPVRRSRRRTVRVGEQRARVLGPVGASETILDVTT